jgi:hypothetical protein
MENNEINEMMPSLNASSPTSTSNSSKDSTSVNKKRKNEPKLLLTLVN